MRVLVISLLLLICTISVSFAKEVPYTLEDRDRLISVEESIKAVNQRIDFMQNIILGGFEVIFSGMIALVGFILWDRRSTLAPVVRKNRELEEDLLIALRKTRELEEQEANILKALREYAKDDSKLQEILRGVKLLYVICRFEISRQGGLTPCLFIGFG